MSMIIAKRREKGKADPEDKLKGMSSLRHELQVDIQQA